MILLGDEWAQVSEEAKDLVHKLLTIDPLNRISASQALEHPFITTVLPNIFISQETLKRLKAFRVTSLLN